MRRAAVLGLGHLAYAGAIPHLVEAVEDPSIDVVIAATGTLENLTGQDFGAPEVDPWRRWRSTPYDPEPLRARVREWAATRAGLDRPF